MAKTDLNAKMANQQQAKRLRQRVEQAQRVLMNSGRRKRIEEPAKVKAARKLAEEYDRKVRAESTKQYSAVTETVSKVKDVILFGSLAEAVAAVEKLEAAAEKVAGK